MLLLLIMKCYKVINKFAYHATISFSTTILNFMPFFYFHFFGFFLLLLLLLLFKEQVNFSNKERFFSSPPSFTSFVGNALQLSKQKNEFRNDFCFCLQSTHWKTCAILKVKVQMEGGEEEEEEEDLTKLEIVKVKLFIFS